MPGQTTDTRPAPRRGVIRTPDTCFAEIKDFPWPPRYFEVEPGLCMAYVDAGPKDATETLLLLHGEPMWGYLYRKMIPAFEAAGYRVVVPDLIGFGRSDKFTDREAYTYSNHVGWVSSLIKHLDLQRVTIFGQDWGGLIGGRVLAENIERFARAVFSNTDMPGTGPSIPGLKRQQPLTPEILKNLFGMDWRATVGEGDAIDPEKVHALVAAKAPLYFLAWRVYSQEVEALVPSRIVSGWCRTSLSDAAKHAYDAPFPTQEYVAGPRRFPMLVPITGDDPERLKNDAAWAVLEKWQGPVLTLWGDSCPFTFASRGQNYRKRLPGASHKAVTHKVYAAGHFTQEDVGEEMAAEIIGFIQRVPAGTKTDTTSQA